MVKKLSIYGMDTVPKDILTPRPLGQVFTAKNGVKFYATTIYNVASKNIGIAQETDEEIILYANTLYAVPYIASSVVQSCCERYNSMITD